MALYELKDIKKFHNDGFVLDIPSLALSEGVFHVVYGLNASGKSTLLNLLGFLSEASEGRIMCCHNGGNRDITLVMQHPYLFNTTVLKNVSLGLRFRSLKREKIEAIIGPVMETLGIWALRDRHVDSLSGGEKRRVALGRAMALDAKVLLLDEPTAHVDEMNAGVIEKALHSLCIGNKRTVIMATHDFEQARRLTGNIICLSNGKIINEKELILAGSRQ